MGKLFGVLLSTFHSIVKSYWQWRIKRNNQLLLSLLNDRECLKEHNIDCTKINSLIESLQHLTLSAQLELMKVSGVSVTN